jgi:hypothetical protein
MSIEVVPALRAQRDLLDLPRGMERFDAYVKTMIDPNDRVILPLQTFNPMSREHVAEVLDALLDMGAEEIAAEAARDADRRIGGIERPMRLLLVVADDARGGWTDRSITDYEFRFTKKAMLGEGWVQVIEWSSEGASVERIHRDVQAQMYRTLYLDRFGLPVTLGEMIRQEGMASAFAGSSERELAADDLEYTREAIKAHLDSKDRGVHIACLYGDEAAASCGYAPSGFSRWAGFAAAHAEAVESVELQPEAILTQGMQS